MMERNEVVQQLRELQAIMEGKYRTLSNAEREHWALILRGAVEVVLSRPTSNGQVLITREDVERLRHHAKVRRSQPGLIPNMIWETEFADRLEGYLDAAQEGQEPEGDQPEHPDGDEAREATETSGRDRLAESGQVA